MINKLKLKRTSVMPNKYGSYAYEIVDSEKPEVAELLASVNGIYDAQNGSGGKILFSLNRLGETNRPFMADIRTQQRNGTDEVYIQLVDNTLDTLATVGAGYKAAERFGAGFAQTYANIGLQKMFEGGAKPVAAPVAVKEKAGAGGETPVAHTDIGGEGGGENEDKTE